MSLFFPEGWLDTDRGLILCESEELTSEILLPRMSFNMASVTKLQLLNEE